MVANQPYPESDPRHHTCNIKDMLNEVITHARADVEKVDEPRAQALFETTAEVLNGLMMAYEHYEAKREPAFRG
jgi:hypothetical protein